MLAAAAPTMATSVRGVVAAVRQPRSAGLRFVGSRGGVGMRGGAARFLGTGVDRRVAKRSQLHCRAGPSATETQDAADTDATTADVLTDATRNEKWESRVAEHAAGRAHSGDCGNAYGVLLATLALGNVPFVQQWRFSYAVYFTALASTVIYIGAHRALSTKQESIGLNQGLLAPILTSAALFGVYCLLTYFPDLDLKTLLGAYFWLLATVAVSGNLKLPLNRWVGSLTGGLTWRLGLPKWLGAVDVNTGDMVTEVDVSPFDLVALGIGLCLATADFQSGHANFTLNNLIATLIAVDVLQLVGLNSYRTAVALSAGLLLYDVFWVFGSSSVVGENVMMTVATSDAFTGPFRLIFPRWETLVQPGATGDFPFSLLGLGDVAVPGLLICLMLKLDAFTFADERRKMAAGAAFTDAFGEATEEEYDSGDVALLAAAAADSAFDREADEQGGDAARPQSLADLGERAFFLNTLGAYGGGLVFAFAVNYVTKAGQPALLYLVPATLGASVAVALRRGELSRLLAFEDKTKRDSFVDL